MKKIIFIGILCLALASIANSMNSIYVLLHKRDLLIAAQNALVKQQKENEQLKNQLQEVSKESYIEEEARNKLLLIKPGEHPVFISKDLLGIKSNEAKKIVEKSNWEQWKELFLGNY